MSISRSLSSSPTVIDISVTLRQGLARWPGDAPWKLEPLQRMNQGAACNLSAIGMGVHMGTHVDAPWHFGEGDRTVETIPLRQMVIPARVLDCTHVTDAIHRDDIKGKLEGVEAVLFKTANSGKLERREPFDVDFVHLGIDAADVLVEQGIQTVGIDYLSIEGYQAAGAPVHHRLLGAGIFIVEGLDLTEAETKDYLLAVLPLKIEGADGAPARAVLIDAL